MVDPSRQPLKVSAAVGFGINVLADILPEFMDRYPGVQVTLNLSSRHADLVSEDVDCAIRLGPLRDPTLVATPLGSIGRYPCSSQSYSARRGMPATPEDLLTHDTIGIPNSDGGGLPWTFLKGGSSVSIDPKPRICVDEALTIFRLVQNGAGIAVLSAYLCGPEIAAGNMVRLLPEWTCPPLAVSIVFPAGREPSPATRAFAEFLKEPSIEAHRWRQDPLSIAKPEREYPP